MDTWPFFTDTQSRSNGQWQAQTLMNNVGHPKNPSITNPETMHLISEIPEPAADGA